MSETTTPPPAAADTSPPAGGEVSPVAPAATPPPSFVNPEMRFDFSQAAAVLPQEMHGAIDGFQARFGDKTVPDVLQSYHELETAHTQLQMQAKVPDESTAEAYGISKPEGLTDDQWAAEMPKLQPYLDAAKEAGVSAEGFQKLYAKQMEVDQANEQARETAKQEARTAAENVLMGKWGNEYGPKGETAANHAQAVFAELGVNDSPDAQALIDNPVFLEVMHHQAQNFGEDPTVLPGGASSSPMSNPERGLDIMTNPNNPHHAKYLEETEQTGGKTPTLDWVMQLRSGVTKPRGSV